MRRSSAPSNANKRLKIGSPDLRINHALTSVEKAGGCGRRTADEILSLINSSCSRENDVREKERGQEERGTEDFAGSLSSKRCFEVLWCKRSSRKHKKWEGDGTLEVSGRSLVLKDLSNTVLSQVGGCKTADVHLSDGDVLPVGSKEVQIQRELSAAECDQLLHSTCVPSQPGSGQPVTMTTEGPAPLQVAGDNNTSSTTSSSSSTTTSSSSSSGAVTSGGRKHFVSPLVGGPLRTVAQGRVPAPRFDPLAPAALVMPQPPANYQWQHNQHGVKVVDVVVDPHLSRHLRPHQREGVVFLYSCVMGLDGGGRGAILADDMGLGKTLQCLALIWTLLRQGPFGGDPVLCRVLIVTPSSLVRNWQKECAKWLGSERLSIYAVDKEQCVSGFSSGRRSRVMAISYEMLLRHVDEVRQCRFELLVCDEGHRLKNSSIKISTALRSLKCERRVLLTGTPVQNDLGEFFQLADFVNPGALGSYSEFQSEFESVILRGRQPAASAAARAQAERGAGRLTLATSRFVLRRTRLVLADCLPPRVEAVVVCLPSPLQCRLYRLLLTSRHVCRLTHTSAPLTESGDGDGGGGSVSPLVYISLLRKLCNHPQLLSQQDLMAFLSPEQIAALRPLLTAPAQGDVNCVQSGKLSVVRSLITHLPPDGATGKSQKIVLISYYTQTLDLLASLCRQLDLTFLRLDGTTSVSQRQSLVDAFNSPYSSHSVFLLSAKAGGVGLNLTGASHIVLFDQDWNPANDQQALARVWRDGQRNTARIYRLLTAGTIEEKIFQRQISKQSLSSTVIGSSCVTSQFSVDDMRELFTFDENVASSTHALLNCRCHVTTDVTAADSSPRCCDRSPLDGGSGAVEERDCQLGRVGDDSEGSDTGSIDKLLLWQHLFPPFQPLTLLDEGLMSASEWITFILRRDSETPASASLVQ